MAQPPAITSNELPAAGCGFPPDESRRGALLIKLLDTVGRRDICVLHGYETYPETIPSDVDVVATRRGLHIILTTQFEGWQVVQCLRHEHSCYYLVYATTAEGQPEFLALDVALDFRRDGCVFYDGQEILNRATVNERNLPVPPPDIEFGYYVMKKIGKASIDLRQAARLSRLWRLDPTRSQLQLSRFLPANAARLVNTAAETGDWSLVNRRIKRLRRMMSRHMIAKHFWTSFTYRLLEVGRAFGRIRRPTGMVISFLGPDGAGKSTLIDHLERWLREAFRRVARYHLRPRWGRPGPKSPVTDPHGQPPRGLLSSLAKLVLWVADGTMGYMVAIWPRKVRSTLVLFDRSFHDILVDPRRYRYGGPMWLSRVAGAWVIKPDLFIILDASIADLHSRKQEVALAESDRQRLAYLDLGRTLPNAHLVDAMKPPKHVASQAARIILNHLAERTTHELATIMRREVSDHES
jgi:thymidylate kinase